jgi:hypothetical protein
MEQLTEMTAAEPNPLLKVLSVDMMDGESDKVLLRCEHPNTCLPFYVLVHWGHSGEGSGRPGQSVENLEQSGSRSQNLLVRSGKIVKLVLDGNYIHMTLPVLCLQSGGRGQRVRVISKETKKRYFPSLLKAGDHVISCPSVFCGYCEECMSGHPNRCTNRQATQRRADSKPRLSQNGQPVRQFSDLSTYAEKMLVHENALVKIIDDSRRFMAEYRGRGMRVQSFDEMQIAVADAGRSGANQDLVILRIVDIDLFDFQRLIGTMKYCGLHSCTISIVRCRSFRSGDRFII